MLKEAVELAEQGRAVYVMAANHHQAGMLEDAIGREKAQKLGIKFEGDLHQFDWNTLRIRGSHPNCVFLIDHYLIEQRFSNILSILHRYDP